MVTNQLCHGLAAYKTLLLNGFEKIAIINAVPIPRWTYRGLFLGNRQHMAGWDDMLLQFSPGDTWNRTANELTPHNYRPKGRWNGTPPNMVDLYNTLGYVGPEQSPTGRTD